MSKEGNISARNLYTKPLFFALVFFFIFALSFSTVGATGYHHDYDDDSEPMVIVATKIVCSDESDLPNWGLGGPDISSTTATTFLANHPNCHAQSGFEFQWSFGDQDGKSPAPVLQGDFVGVATTTSGFSKWNTFGVTDSSGVATTSISDLKGSSFVWVREVLQDGYIPFSFPASNNPVSAELYCYKDVLRYDNYDFIKPATLGKTYYCVAWNVLKPVIHINTPPTISIVGSTPMTINVGGIFTDPGATANDLEDGDLTANILATTTLNTTIPGAYSIVYSVTDSGGLSASTTRIVNVLPPPPPPSTPNQPPVISLLGSNPFDVTLNDTFVDPGATAVDSEDGNITANIIASSTVNTTVLGTYLVVYSATDSGGLTATTTRNVNVVPPPPAQNLGSIKFCLILANTENVIATTSTGLPAGAFTINLATSTSFGSTTVGSKVWDASTFVVDSGIINMSGQDAKCEVFDNIPVGQYFYSQLATTGPLWSTPKYSDQFNQPVNNIFDLFSYSGELFTATTTDDSLRNLNSDGEVNISVGNNLRTVILFATYNPAPVCTTDCGGGSTPTPTANISVSKTADKTTANVGESVTYTIVVSNAGPDTANSVSVNDTLPTGLTFVSASSTLGSYATSTNLWTIGSLLNNASTTLTLVASINSGTEGQAINNIATASSTVSDPTNTDNTSNVVVNVNPATGAPPTNPPSNPNPPCTANCGGGGGGGPIYPNNLTIFNESVIQTVPGIAMVNWNTNLSADSRVVYDIVSHDTIGTGSNFGYGNSTDLVASTTTLHGMAVGIDPNKTYYFRAISVGLVNGVNQTVIGKELILNPGTVTGGAPNSCYYLFDYLRVDFNNNPVEVKKLQVFLRDLEGFTNLKITGVYDPETVQAVNVFQEKYRGDVLTPWGHDKATGYTYILTKKKVNEIYCKTAFPVTVQQQSEIDSYRNFLQSLKNEGISVPTEEPANSNSNIPVQNNVVGKGNKGNTDSTVATGKSTTTATSTAGILSRLTANALSAGKNVVNSIGKTTVFLDGVLLIAIGALSYLLYRERKTMKSLEEINEEIDLSNR